MTDFVEVVVLGVNNDERNRQRGKNNQFGDQVSRAE